MEPNLHYEIRIRGHVSAHWQSWFEGFTLENLPNGDALLTGPVADQAALYGLLNRLRDLGVTLIALRCVELDTGFGSQEA